MDEALSRDDALALLADGCAKLSALFEKVSEEDFARAGTIGGDWSAKDLMGHIIFWEENALTALREFRSGQDSSLDRAIEERGLDRLNLDALAAKAAMSTREVRVSSAKVHAKLVHDISAMTEADWEARLPGDETWGSELGSILGGPGGPFRHAWAHLDELRGFIGSIRSA